LPGRGRSGELIFIGEEIGAQHLFVVRDFFLLIDSAAACCRKNKQAEERY